MYDSPTQPPSHAAATTAAPPQRMTWSSGSTAADVLAGEELPFLMACRAWGERGPGGSMGGVAVVVPVPPSHESYPMPPEHTVYPAAPTAHLDAVHHRMHVTGAALQHAVGAAAVRGWGCLSRDGPKVPNPYTCQPIVPVGPARTR